MALGSLENSWPIMATLYTSAVVGMENLRVEQVKIRAAELQDPAHARNLVVRLEEGKPVTVMSVLNP